MAGAVTIPADANAISVGDADLANLIHFIRDQAGIVLQDYQSDNLRKAISEACIHFGLKDAADFVARLHTLPPDAPEQEFLISRVTIGESYFFRDEGQISFLRDSWLPQVVKTKRKANDLSLRIWCAGCSNGQEPYTVSMLLEDTIPDLVDWDVTILATDINAGALRSAISARYSSWSFRITPVAVRDRFFKQDGAFHVLNDKTRAPVVFSYLNLATDPFPSLLNHTANMDLILCRNVFIYFDRETVSRIVGKFTSCLVPGGHLVVGASDPVALENDGLIYAHAGDAGYFRRADGAAPVPDTPRRGVPSPVPRKVPLSPSPAPSPSSNLPPVVAPPAPPANPPGDTLFGYIRGGDWNAALLEIQTREAAGQGSADLARSKIKVLANMGRLMEALSECEALLEDGNTDKHNHFMLGLILLDNDDATGAEKAFRSAVFLDRTFVEAHYQLGMTLIRLGRRKNGMKSLNNALALAEAAPPDRVLHESAGMTMERMIDILRQSFDLYGEA